MSSGGLIPLWWGATRGIHFSFSALTKDLLLCVRVRFKTRSVIDFTETCEYSEGCKEWGSMYVYVCVCVRLCVLGSLGLLFLLQ